MWQFDRTPLARLLPYAGLASVMIALVFLYSIAAIFVSGGELNAAIMGARKVHPKRRRWGWRPSRRRLEGI